MGMDISKFSPKAQARIMQKLAAQEREKAERKAIQIQTEKKNKYHNTPDARVVKDGKVIKFASQKEARRFDELMIMLKAGMIRDLRLQQNFTLQEAYTLPNGNRVKAIVYKADFVYEKRVTKTYQVDGGVSYETVDEWEKVVEDVKGGKATKTRVYAIKKKLMQEKFGITISELDI